MSEATAAPADAMAATVRHAWPNQGPRAADAVTNRWAICLLDGGPPRTVTRGTWHRGGAWKIVTHHERGREICPTAERSVAIQPCDRSVNAVMVFSIIAEVARFRCSLLRRTGCAQHTLPWAARDGELAGSREARPSSRVPRDAKALPNASRACAGFRLSCIAGRALLHWRPAARRLVRWSALRCQSSRFTFAVGAPPPAGPTALATTPRAPNGLGEERRHGTRELHNHLGVLLRSRYLHY